MTVEPTTVQVKGREYRKRKFKNGQTIETLRTQDTVRTQIKQKEH